MKEKFNLLNNAQIVRNRSKQYISENTESVRSSNQKMLKGISVFYTIIVAFYLYASTNAFAAWGVTKIYMTALIVQIPILAFILIRYRKPRSINEVKNACSIVQLYMMVFVGILSIFPVEMEQPAVYFSPIAMAFSVSFIFSYQRTLGLIFIEVVSYLVVAGILKPINVFYVDLFSCILALAMTVYITIVLYSYRLKQNDTRKELEYMSKVDMLTGIYNKATSEQLVRTDLKNRASGDPYAFMIIDFDNFKNVNDTLGHKEGDRVLAAFGNVLKEAVGEGNVAGRIGGDEFMTYIRVCENLDDVENIALQILRNIKNIPSKVEGYEFSCSIGIYYSEEPIGSYGTLYNLADKALYNVKKRGKNDFEVYQE